VHEEDVTPQRHPLGTKRNNSRQDRHSHDDGRSSGVAAGDARNQLDGATVTDTAINRATNNEQNHFYEINYLRKVPLMSDEKKGACSCSPSGGWSFFFSVKCLFFLFFCFDVCTRWESALLKGEDSPP